MLGILFSMVVLLMEQEEGVILSGIKAKYQSNDTIVFDIVNVSDDTVYVFLGLERKDEDGWRFVTDDITKDVPRKGTAFYSLKSKKEHEMIWFPSKVFWLYPDTPENREVILEGTMRFVIKYGKELRGSYRRGYSREFELHK